MPNSPGSVGGQFDGNLWVCLISSMEYVVKDHDSLERIAAYHECTVGELMKMNRMGSRMVFPGQKLMVPSLICDNVLESEETGHHSHAARSGERLEPCSESADGIRIGPGSAVLVQQRSLSTSSGPENALLSEVEGVAPGSSGLARLRERDEDTDCLQRFLKIRVKEVTETDGTVSGTLLVTPNALMFDPDVTHPLVVENGQDLYMMMAHMDEIMSVAVFKDIEALMCEADSADKMYDPEHVRTPSVGQSPSRSRAQVGLEFQKNAMDETRNVFDADVEDSLRERAPPEGSVNDSSKTEGIFATVEHGEVISAGLSILGESAGGLPEIAEEEREGKKQFEATSPLATSTRRAFSETTPEREINVGFAVSERDQPNVPLPPIQGKQETDQTRMQSDLQSRISTTSLPRFSSASSSSSLSRLGRTLSARAHSIKGSVASGAGKVTQTAMSGTKSVAHGVVTHTKSAADTLQTGIESSAKMAANRAKVAVDAMVSLPQGIVNVSTGILEGLQPASDDATPSNEVRTEASLRREQSLATLEALKHKTQLAREQACRDSASTVFSCATSARDMPELFRPVQELLKHGTANTDVQHVATELPYYMIVRLNRKKKLARPKPVRASVSSTANSTSFEEELIGNCVRREFWFAIPRHKAQSVYQFLLQWNPEKYGQESSTLVSKDAVGEDSKQCAVSGYQYRDDGFLVLDSEADEKLAGTGSIRCCTCKLRCLEGLMKH
ncbi:Oxidation resistance protein 1 [Toxocara canis]|uniref:Oxidation resistance protein 1 n=1 Tax=Toxocara canis TaxID=6265 RepID=A0A0B2VVQ4_TOXCA|nr:Oxidation resistance protein 1 [Toxocara canis]